MMVGWGWLRRLLGESTELAALRVELGQALEARDLARAQLELAAPTPTVVAPPPSRSAIARRVATRHGRLRCRHPAKYAYNLDDPAERALAESRLGEGLRLYLCRCGWHHIGHPPGQPPPAEARRAAEIAAIGWRTNATTVVLLTGQGDIRAAGTVIAYHDAPTVEVATADGRLTWRADLVREANPNIPTQQP